MKRILLHIGQPKTATTTFQHHFFEKLHQEGKINFLGKLLKFDKQTNMPIFLKNESKLLRDIFEGKRELADATLIDPLLKEGVLNVFSDEGLLVYYPGRNNLTLEKKIQRMKLALSGYEVEVVINLRNPLDYFYSFYVQLFLQFYKCSGKLYSFDKYVDFLAVEPNNPMFESYHYQALLEKLYENFTFHTLLFEDMIHDKENVYKVWAGIMGLTVEEVANYLDNKHENKKNKSKDYIATNVNIYSYLPKIKSTLSAYPRLYSYAAKLYHIDNRAFRRLINKKFPFVEDRHFLPNVDQKIKINNALLLSEKFPFEKYGLSQDKLIRYNYMDEKKS